MSFWNFISQIVNPVTDLVSEYIPDADKRAEFETKLRMALMDQESSFIEASRDIVVAEAQGESWLQRNWRPIIMLTFGAILANNYILVPYVPGAVVLEIPDGMWSLLTIGLGGYVVGRTIEKTGSGVSINVGQNQSDPSL
jgi:hypothetical protein